MISICGEACQMLKNHEKRKWRKGKDKFVHVDRCSTRAAPKRKSKVALRMKRPGDTSCVAGSTPTYPMLIVQLATPTYPMLIVQLRRGKSHLRSLR